MVDRNWEQLVVLLENIGFQLERSANMDERSLRAGNRDRYEDPCRRCSCTLVLKDAKTCHVCGTKVLEEKHGSGSKP